MIIKKINEVFIQITDCDEYSLESYFKIKDEECFFKPSFKMGIWDGFIRYYDRNTRLLPIGLFPQLQTYIKDNNIECDYDFNNFNNFTSNDITDFIVNNGLDVSRNPYPFQLKSIQRALNYKRGVIQSPTGSGKSLIIFILCRYLLNNNKKILIITPQVDLVNQLFNDFISYGWGDCDKFVNALHGKVKLYIHNKPVLISTYQSLSILDKSIFKTFDSVIIDEVHTAKALSIKEILIQCENAEYRIGLTATMHKKDIDKFTIYSYVGKKIFDIPIKTLQVEGFLTPLVVNVITFKYPEELKSTYKLEFDKEYNFISKIPKRNELLKHILNQINPTENILILCKNIVQVKEAYNYLQENIKGYSLYKIQGDVKSENRDEIIKNVENNQSCIIVATYGTMSTGRNVKRLHHVILFSPYKSDIKVLQSIGRGTRLHETKKLLQIWDIVDDLSYYDQDDVTIKSKKKLKENHLLQHSKLRLNYYKDKEFPVKKTTVNYNDI